MPGAQPVLLGLWMVFGQQLDRVLKWAGLERFLGAMLAALMIVAVALFLL